MSRMIFYHPYKLAENPRKGSELRPKKMKESFENIGYNVDLVVGDSSERKAAMKMVKKNIDNGKEYDFLYAESSNMPIPLTDSNHLPLRPFQDFNFFRMLNREKIPTGFFYRDLYWRVDELKKKVSYYKYLPKQLFHYIEWAGVKKTVDYLFLPTKSMAEYFPTQWPDERVGALFPGCELVSSTRQINSPEPNTPLTLFYVGGTRPPYYDLTPLMEVVSALENTELILCCRKTDWNENRHHYKSMNFENITIVHADSSAITEYYKKADLFFDIRKPEGYLTNTIPIKVLESIGNLVPLLLLEGTESAEFVRKEGAGWIVNTVKEAEDLLIELRDDKKKISAKVNDLQKIRQRHTWEERAKKASRILTALRNNF